MTLKKILICSVILLLSSMMQNMFCSQSSYYEFQNLRNRVRVNLCKQRHAARQEQQKQEEILKKLAWDRAWLENQQQLAWEEEKKFKEANCTSISQYLSYSYSATPLAFKKNLDSLEECRKKLQITEYAVHVAINDCKQQIAHQTKIAEK